MSRRTKLLFRKWFPYAAVLLIAILILVGTLLLVKDHRETDPTVNPSETKPTVSVNESESSDGSYIELPSDETEQESKDPNALPTVPAVDGVSVISLIQEYFSAKLDSDADHLNRIVDSDEPYVHSKLVTETQFISDYVIDEHAVYVLPGISSSTFVVYVKYDIFFNKISTGAPSLNCFIICKDEGGHYWIYNRAVSAEFSAYLSETQDYPQVAELAAEVDRQLAENRKKDRDLDELMKVLQNGIPSSDKTEETESEE